MNYVTPYGKSGDLALENERLKSLVKELKQRPNPWTQVLDCKIFHEEPYDFDYCKVHDRTFDQGGTCDHAGLSEIDYLSDREMQQRGRAVRAEMKLDNIRYIAETSIHTPEIPFDPYEVLEEIN